MAQMLKRASGRRLSDAQLAYILILPLVIFQASLTLYPASQALWMSLHKFDLTGQMTDFVGAQNYIRALMDPAVTHSVVVSIAFTVAVVALTVFLGIGGAILLNEEFKGRSAIRVLVILPWAVPEYATAIIYGYMYSENYGTVNGALYQLGLIDSYLPLLFMGTIYLVAVAYAWHFAPLAIYFFLGALQTIPQDLYNQAKIDGASAFKRFVTTTLPYLRYPLLIVLVLSTVEALKALDIVWVMTSGGPGDATQVLTYQIYRQTFQLSDFGYGATLSFVLLLVIIALTTVYFLTLTTRRRR